MIRSVEFLNHRLSEGMTVVFQEQSYDFHAGVTRFWFSKQDGSESIAWHVFDNDPEPSETWRTYFQAA